MSDPVQDFLDEVTSEVFESKFTPVPADDYAQARIKPGSIAIRPVDFKNGAPLLDSQLQPLTCPRECHPTSLEVQAKLNIALGSPTKFERLASKVMNIIRKAVEDSSLNLRDLEEHLVR